jgi:hypothetical protein
MGGQVSNFDIFPMLLLYGCIRLHPIAPNMKKERWPSSVYSHTAGTANPVGDFDIANVNFVAPADGSTLQLPVKFQFFLAQIIWFGYNSLSISQAASPFCRRTP